ncbi:hypothetical protein [Flavihumibacter solisilvae]|uniref:Uncharacterized protein n=1 Tax=Flavihumibacter solisilvae TaxID=1349421 RepID=A0A0C1KVD2_9BACT|nr:hypothetical protein [Flavihumibacter solisilvae]KIC91316.1 hypothetical protein OI18_22365 [Flavihumibacter solisilvae]
MATSSINLLTHGYQGKVGDQFVFRNKAGKSIMAAKPKPRRKAKTVDSELTQEAIQENFKNGTIYAKRAMVDEELKPLYEAARRPNQTPYHIAFMDWMKAPKVKDLRLDDYDGQPGQKIVVRATDNFKIKAVKFILRSPDGTKLEEGEAVLNQNGVDWTYTAQVQNPSVPGTILKVIALDLPENQTSLEKVL